jgi:hypothetical protein
MMVLRTAGRGQHEGQQFVQAGRGMSAELDHRVRLAAFQWLQAQMDVVGEVLPRSLLAEGFVRDCLSRQRTPSCGMTI